MLQINIKDTQSHIIRFLVMHTNLCVAYVYKNTKTHETAHLGNFLSDFCISKFSFAT